MPDELLFRVQSAVATPAKAITLTDAGLKERQHLQEWVIAQPKILGPGVKVVAFEFDRWTAAAAGVPHDRLDVLGLDDAGYLVVAELKREEAPDPVAMQVIKYAAMASRFTPETLASQHARFLSLRGQVTTEEDALSLLEAHAPLDIETLRRPRVVILARSFPAQVTATAVWLNEMGVSVTLVRFQAYEAGDEIVLSVSQLYPVAEVAEFTVTPQQAQVIAAEESTKRRQDVSAVRRLIDAQVIPNGGVFTFRSRTEINSDMRTALDEWVAENPERGIARWQNKASAPLIWDGDLQEYTPSGLVRSMILAATGIDRGVWGTKWWVDPDGRDLTELAADTLSGKPRYYFSFWTRFLERLHRERPSWTSAHAVSADNWMSMPSPFRIAVYSVVFPGSGQLRTELYIDGGDAAANEALFGWLMERRDEIKAVFGDQLTWEELPGRQACRIAAYKAGDVTRTEDYEDYLDWFFDTGDRLRKALAGPAHEYATAGVTQI
ncbi:MAG TPA: DUF4268 domain-containing protein [Acidimicrobiales bacterium]|nr:DUF4268 domain-containing protein [Acidimicrobiales bacterium]